MKKVINILLFGALLFGSITACDKEDVVDNSGTNSDVIDNPVEQVTLTGIELNVGSVKRLYTYGDSLDLTGLIVTANYSDKTSKVVTEYTTDPSNGSVLNESGNKNVTVSYEGKSLSFSVFVELALENIRLNTESVKKTYSQGEALDLTGLVVDAGYNDGSYVPVSNYTTNPSNGTVLNEIGDKEVTVTYKDKTEKFIITVNKALTGITINKDSLQKEYTWGSPFWAIGLVVTAHYSDGSTETVPSTDYTITPEERSGLIIPGEQTVTVSYCGFTDSYTINVDKTAKSIYLVTDNVKTNYRYGEKFTSAGLLVNAVYANNSAELVNGYTLSIEEDTVLKTPGTQTVTVTYNGCTTSYDINVEAGEPFLDTSEVKTTYVYGDYFDSTGLKVGFRYSDGTVDYTTDYEVCKSSSSFLNSVGGWSIDVNFKDHYGVDSVLYFLVDVEGQQETGRHLKVDLAKNFNFGAYTSHNFSVRQSPSSNYEAQFMLWKNSTRTDSMSLVDGTKLRFLEGDAIENIYSLAGVTTITVNGGKGNYKLFVGYTKDNMGVCLTPQIVGDTYYYYNIPKINYFRLEGFDNDNPADISSIEFDYTRDTDFNLVYGEPTSVDEAISPRGAFYNSSSCEMSVRGETIVIGSTTYSFTGMVYNGDAVYYDKVTKRCIGVQCINNTYYHVKSYTEPDAVYVGDYFKGQTATELTMYINGESVAPNTTSTRREITYGSSFSFSAESNAWPNQQVNIELVNENTSGDAPATFENGVVTANNAGNFKIVCTAYGGFTSTLYFTVLHRVPAKVNLITNTTIEINVGDFYFIQASVNEDASDKTLTYTCDNFGFVLVEDNVITGLKVGIAYVRVTSADNDTVSILVKVNPVGEGIVYNFKDESNVSHELVLYSEEAAYIDNYLFTYNVYNCRYEYEANSDHFGFNISTSDSKTYLDYFDYTSSFFDPMTNGLYSGYGRFELISANNGGSSSGTSPEEQGESGTTVIVPVPVPTPTPVQDVIENYIFIDDHEIAHTVCITVGKGAVIDNLYEFEKVGTQYLYKPRPEEHIYIYTDTIPMIIVFNDHWESWLDEDDGPFYKDGWDDYTFRLYTQDEYERMIEDL